MTRWKTKELVDLFSGEGLVVYSDNPGGDYDTSVIIVKPEKSNDCLFVSGFVTDDDPIQNWDDVDIEMVEVSDGRDSRGGLNSNDPNVIQAYADVRKKLALKGFVVVNSMEEYF